MVKWNLLKLSEALDPYVDKKESKKYVETNY